MARSTLAAAAEERQRKLQEYLAAKGKLKCQNSKPYLKAKNNCPNPLPSKSSIKPKKDVALPVKATQPINIKLQPRPANIPGSQKPKLEPPKLLGKRPTSGYVSSNPNCKPSSSHQQRRKAGSSPGELSRKAEGSHNIQEPQATKQQVTDQENAAHIDSVGNVPGEGESVHNFLKETNKENLPQTLPDSEKLPHPQVWTKSKPKTSSSSQTKSSLAPKRALGRRSVNRAVLKDRANTRSVGETQTRVPPRKSQQLPKGTALVKPGEKRPKAVPSPFVQTLTRHQASQKPGVKDMKDIKVNNDQYEGLGGAKLPLHAVTEQKVERTKRRTCLSLLQGGFHHRHPHIKQDQKPTQPHSRPQTSCVQQKSKAVSRRPDVAVGSFTSVIPNTPSTRASRAKGNRHSSSYQQKARTLDSKLKGTLPQNHCLNKTAPKTQTGGTAMNGRGVLNRTQTNPDVKKKITAEDRRKQLEEWQKSKGKMYKRPPMELKTKRKIIEEMNMSFWKSMEKEEEERKAQLELSNKINSTLTECLQLIEGGVLSNEVFTVLSSIPEAEKFAKFWICKAKFLASKGTFDVIGLYEEAIRSGATPIQELREVVLNILQDPNRTRDGITSNSVVAETNITSTEELARDMESGRKSCLSPKNREQFPATPQITKAEEDNHPGIKLQVAPIPRISGMPEVRDMKLITPVRRSARIERAVSRYPEMLQDHDLVVSSLNELLEVEDTECFVFRKNEALPITLGFQVLES
ncbi:cytoskeleton-associated protein 2-like isoform X2 [Desmodus rotundus]|uniref:cytoskeleton-associated protein 2-like isoform X2 n=1 Tax=Desmodus rotundus TaxID=9430 RepID=UPI0023815B6A|nr:cytoskeleton-associated protein 2-like isoform X2 [Desmodus rotundus]